MATLTEPLVAPAPAFAGFDTSIYPGTPNMTKWKASSPYEFVAYYLASPCHRKSSWMGQRAALIGMGWNVLPVYVGQQAAGASKCTANTLTADQGQKDAGEAATTMSTEGFPAGTFVYLDVERVEKFSSELGDYITAWMTELSASDYSPGVYCHLHNADDVRAAVLAGLPDPPAVQPRLWIVGGSQHKFNIKTSKPTDVGADFANLWQCPVSGNKTFGAVTINIDEDVADSADPAAP